MDSSFHNLYFSANPKSQAFNPCKSVLTGETGLDTVSCDDTTLRLDSLGSAAQFASNLIGAKRKWSFLEESGNERGFLLDLRLWHSSSSSDTNGSTTTGCTSMSSVKEVNDSSMDLELDFTLHLEGEKSSDSEKSFIAQPTVDLQLSLFSGPAVSEVTNAHLSNDTLDLDTHEGFPVNHFGGSHAGNSIDNVNFLNQPLKEITSSSPSFSSSVARNISTTCTSGITQSKQQQQRVNTSKMCQFLGCVKGARGATGLCIAHGGGRRCQRLDCHKGAEGRTAFCKAHGGGRRCELLGCTKSAEGCTDFCIAHGGGRRCSLDGCTRASRGKSGLCIRHGGGKRCQRENCTKSAEGLSGLCISHGGGRRCQYPECQKGAQGSTKFCKAHGGGKRCTYPGCQKGAEGSTSFCKGHGGGKRCSFQGSEICPKSVHGGTLFCVAHGGGKRCAVSDCTKSARGRTDFCVRHGGGKRCQQEFCGKSAQGSTDFCKAHGVGKRCTWGHPGSYYGIGDDPCTLYFSSKTGICTRHENKRVHGNTIIETDLHDLKAIQTAETKSPFDYNANIRTHIASHVANLPAGKNMALEKSPEGRVHGGNLLTVAVDFPGPSRYMHQFTWS